MLMDVFDRTKSEGPFGMDQMSLWMFWTGPNILQGSLTFVFCLLASSQSKVTWNIPYDPLVILFTFLFLFHCYFLYHFSSKVVNSLTQSNYMCYFLLVCHQICLPYRNLVDYWEIILENHNRILLIVAWTL